MIVIITEGGGFAVSGVIEVVEELFWKNVKMF